MKMVKNNVSASNIELKTIKSKGIVANPTNGSLINNELQNTFTLDKDGAIVNPLFHAYSALLLH